MISDCKVLFVLLKAQLTFLFFLSCFLRSLKTDFPKDPLSLITRCPFFVVTKIFNSLPFNITARTGGSRLFNTYRKNVR